MANSYFQFKHFTIHQNRCAMKVTTDGCLFGAWVAERISNTGIIKKNCLDIGTGTGLQSMMIAQKSGLCIDAIEIDKNAAEQAIENITASPYKEQINIIKADVKSFEFKEKYDVILSNPPFYEKELKGDDEQKNMAHHDDSLLLNDLLTIIKTNLKPDGTFFLLLPYKRNTEIKKLLAGYKFSILQITFIRQTEVHDFFRIMLSGQHNSGTQSETMFNEISIKDKKGNYTNTFTALLKEFYLIF